MKKRLRFKTSIRCRCGATGELVWEEDEVETLDIGLNYQMISITDGFVPKGPGQGVCQSCSIEAALKKGEPDESDLRGSFWGLVNQD